MAAPQMPQESGMHLADNVVHFARILRRAGMAVGPAAVVDAIRAVETAGVTRRDDFFWTLHAVFVTRREQMPVFDEAFELFWRSRKSLAQMLQMPVVDSDGSAAAPPRAGSRRVAEALLAGAEPDMRPRPEREASLHLAASGEEVLKRRDFAQMDAAEIAEAERRIARLVLSEELIVTRRLRSSPPPGMVDLRRTLRSGLRTGGDMLLLQHRRRRAVPAPVVVLCDISGSMGQYTRLFLHFIHALGRTRRVSAFLFGTRLTNVTRELRRRDVDEALAACSAAVPDWSGGTRIGTAIYEFNRLWSRRVLGQGAMVLLLSDGLERDGEERLAAEMDRLHRSCRRLIWLNPLLGYDGFQPRARGIRAMLPHVDEFRPIHSLESMAELCGALGGEPARTADPRRLLRAA
ncbi:MAG TPA: VWA domain-containing protein [Bauldia sp.]|nr:VWA domain-containing protein [Bauldia sp.]